MLKLIDKSKLNNNRRMTKMECAHDGFVDLDIRRCKVAFILTNLEKVDPNNFRSFLKTEAVGKVKVQRSI
jgi:hypothetical protein